MVLSEAAARGWYRRFAVGVVLVIGIRYISVSGVYFRRCLFVEERSRCTYKFLIWLHGHFKWIKSTPVSKSANWTVEFSCPFTWSTCLTQYWIAPSSHGPPRLRRHSIAVTFAQFIPSLIIQKYVRRIYPLLYPSAEASKILRSTAATFMCPAADVGLSYLFAGAAW